MPSETHRPQRQVGRACLLGIVAILGAGPAGAQTLKVALDQSFSSFDDLSTPTGFAVAGAQSIASLPVFVEAGYRSRWDANDDQTFYCPFFRAPDDCVSGAMRRVTRLATVHAAIGVETGARRLRVRVAVLGSSSWTAGALTLVATGERLERNASGGNLGVGAFTEVAMQPGRIPLDVLIRGQVDRIDGSCLLDVSAPFCGGRTFVGGQVGLSWRLGSR